LIGPLQNLLRFEPCHVQEISKRPQPMPAHQCRKLGRQCRRIGCGLRAVDQRHGGDGDVSYGAGLGARHVQSRIKKAAVFRFVGY